MSAKPSASKAYGTHLFRRTELQSTAATLAPAVMAQRGRSARLRRGLHASCGTEMFVKMAFRGGITTISVPQSWPAPREAHPSGIACVLSRVSGGRLPGVVDGHD